MSDPEPPNDPKELTASLYDVTIPAVLSDRTLIGGHVVEGPIETVIGNELCVSFIIGLRMGRFNE